MKSCPIMLAGKLGYCTGVASTIIIDEGAPCIKDKCLWYGRGCPAYPNQQVIDLVAKKGN
jgi:hypothetical protein